MIEEIDAMVVDGRTYITEKAIESGRKLRIIARAGVGLDNSDVKATKKGNLRYMCMHARARKGQLYYPY